MAAKQPASEQGIYTAEMGAPPQDIDMGSVKPQKSKKSDDEAQEMAEYRKRPDYFGYEDYTPSGRAALKAYNEAAVKTKDSVKRKYAPPYSPSAAKVAQKAQREAASEIQRETRGKAGSASSGKYAKGGSVSYRADGCCKKGYTKGKMR